MRKQVTLPFGDAALLKARQAEIKSLRDAGWQFVKNVGGCLVILEKEEPTAEECFDNIKATRGGYSLTALLQNHADQWHDLWSDYNEIGATLGHCDFTEAVERLDELVDNL